MTAILVLAARVVLAAAGGLAFAAAFVTAVYWAGFGPQDGRMLVFLGAMCAVVVGAGLGLYALQPKGDRDG